MGCLAGLGDSVLLPADLPPLCGRRRVRSIGQSACATAHRISRFPSFLRRVEALTPIAAGSHRRLTHTRMNWFQSVRASPGLREAGSPGDVVGVSLSRDPSGGISVPSQARYVSLIDSTPLARRLTEEAAGAALATTRGRSVGFAVAARMPRSVLIWWPRLSPCSCRRRGAIYTLAPPWGAGKCRGRVSRRRSSH